MSREAEEFWRAMAVLGEQVLAIGPHRLVRGSRVRQEPRSSERDALDLALLGRIGLIDGIQEDDGGCPRLAVTLEQDAAMSAEPSAAVKAAVTPTADLVLELATELLAGSVDSSGSEQKRGPG